MWGSFTTTKVFPGVKQGDVVTIDGEVLECTGSVNPARGSFWFKNITGSYYTLRVWDTPELVKLFNEGRLVMGIHGRISGGTEQHSHYWVKYTGLNQIYNYCSCGAKQDIDWREHGDGERKSKNSS